MRTDEVIKNLIEKSGISLRELSRRLVVRYGEKKGPSPNTIEKWCTANGDPRISQLRMISEYFEVPLTSLLPEGAGFVNELTEDERLALDFYRAMRDQQGNTTITLRVLAQLANGDVTVIPAPSSHPLTVLIDQAKTDSQRPSIAGPHTSPPRAAARPEHVELRDETPSKAKKRKGTA